MSASQMSAKERLFHAVLFELGAVLLTTLVVTAASDVGTGSALGVGVLIAVIAMLWNVVFNWIFDQFFTAPRTTRSFGLRLAHTLAFEGGLLIATIPIVAFMLDLTLWQAFVADVAISLLITLYALVFNWAYDHLRERFLVD